MVGTGLLNFYALSYLILTATPRKLRLEMIWQVSGTVRG